MRVFLFFFKEKLDKPVCCLEHQERWRHQGAAAELSTLLFLSLGFIEEGREGTQEEQKKWKIINQSRGLQQGHTNNKKNPAAPRNDLLSWRKESERKDDARKNAQPFSFWNSWWLLRVQVRVLSYRLSKSLKFRRQQGQNFHIWMPENSGWLTVGLVKHSFLKVYKHL